MMRRPRLLPMAIAAMVALFAAKLDSLSQAMARGAPVSGARLPSVLASAQASGPPDPAARAAIPAQMRPPPMPAPPPAPDPAAAAERAVLESLRARRTEIEAREQAIAARELVVTAVERRLARRVDELTALQRRLEALERARGEREEAGWRGLVRLYEGMRPRDAAAIFDDLEMPVLAQIVDRMGERKAAPVIGAMRPERARELTAELARLRAQRPAGE